MPYAKVRAWLDAEMQTLRDSGLFKDEKVIKSPQGATVSTADGELINFCANNYLGLADSPEIKAAVVQGMKTHGYGMASVRFICGTQDIHRTLEARISSFLKTEDTILYTSCFDANTGPTREPIGSQPRARPGRPSEIRPSLGPGPERLERRRGAQHQGVLEAATDDL